MTKKDEADNPTEESQGRTNAKRLSANDVAERLDRVVDSTNDALSAISAQLSALTQAMNRPAASPRNEFDAAAQFGTQESVAEFGDDGVLARPRLEDVNSPEFKAKADQMAFMNEMVTIHVHETSERDADQSFMVSVNGRSVVLQRGNQYTVPRFILEVLSRARPVHYTNQEYIGDDGVRRVRYPSRAGLRYPFSVVTDSDRGKAYTKRLLAS
jgi:hypothetical protein